MPDNERQCIEELQRQMNAISSTCAVQSQVNAALCEITRALVPIILKHMSATEQIEFAKTIGPKLQDIAHDIHASGTTLIRRIDSLGNPRT